MTSSASLASRYWPWLSASFQAMTGLPLARNSAMASATSPVLMVPMPRSWSSSITSAVILGSSLAMRIASIRSSSSTSRSSGARSDRNRLRGSV